ncbi:MAG: hypothetical protein IPL61_33985 [Myxococcales bacterium]|nr:hypothetical protein [Myxococcales bacterium]
MLEAALEADYGSTPLSIHGFAGPGTDVVVVVAPDVEFALRPHEQRASRVPPAPRAGEIWYWKVELRSRYQDGALYVREQGTIFAGGRVASTVLFACGAVVNGAPKVTELWGFGS